MLRNRTLTGMVLLIMMILSADAIAQEMPSGKWWHNPGMTQKLNLTEPEKARLDEEFRNSRRKLIDLKSNVERERFELGNLLELEALNEPAVMQQFKKLETARSDLSTERFSFLLQVRKILGPERFQRVKMLYGKARRHRMHRSAEGPGHRSRP